MWEVQKVPPGSMPQHYNIPRVGVVDQPPAAEPGRRSRPILPPAPHAVSTPGRELTQISDRTRWDFSKRGERVDSSSSLVTTAPSSKCFAADSCLAGLGGRYLSRLSGASSIRPPAPTPVIGRRALLTGE
jgi:hypothetical protein